MEDRTARGGWGQILLAVGAACLVFAIMQGIRDNYGIMMRGIIARTGVDYASVSLAIAVGQILYGATQPLFGMLALRRSNAFVMLCGALLMAAGLAATPFCRGMWSLLLAFGVVLPAGTGALCFGVVMGAITPIIGEARAAVASGIVQASAGIGDALMSPALQGIISSRGVAVAMTGFSVPMLLTVPVILWLGRRGRAACTPAQRGANAQERLTQILGAAIRDRDYWRLLLGFTTCGFHMAIIETHLFSQYVSSGIPGATASLAMTVYGVFTMLGAMAAGFLSLKFRMKRVLGCVYGIRVAIAAAFLLLPKTVPFAFIATGALGLTGDSTVPPTTGIISAKLGAARMAVVYGSIFIGHQIGAFASAALGGALVGTPLGYSALWIMDLCLSLVAAAASLRIRD